MKALFFESELKMRDLPVPEPAEGEVLIRVCISAICNTDLEIIRGYMGFTGVPGHEFVGEVVTPGTSLTGRLVVGEINCPCGNCYLCRTGRPTHCSKRSVLGIFRRDGVFAEYITLPMANLYEVPDGLTPETAVFTEPLAAAIEIFDQIGIRPTERAFIFGAGKLGNLVSQVFRANGCDYTTFDPDPLKVQLAGKMGLNAFSTDNLDGGAMAEVCVDCTGSADGISMALSHLYPRGKLVLKTTVAQTGKLDLNQVVINEYQIIGSRCGPFEPALRMLSAGLVDPRPLISHEFEFGDILRAFETAARPGVLKVLVRH